jgi:hypothetical protein
MAQARNTKVTLGTSAGQFSSGRVLPDLGNTIPENATKRTARSGHDRSNLDGLSQQILHNFEPLVAALNDRPALLAEASADTGHEIPSTQDKGLQILLGSMLSMLWRQNHGTISAPKYSATGQVIGQYTDPNNKERLDQSNQRVSEMTEIDGPDSIKALYYLGVNEARFHSYESLRLSMMAVYREIFNQDWKPQEQTPKKSVPPVQKTSTSDDSWLQKKLAERRGLSA